MEVIHSFPLSYIKKIILKNTNCIISVSFKTRTLIENILFVGGTVVAVVPAEFNGNRIE